MYLRVKKDSVTSIILFIFNVFLVERGVTSVPLKKIFKLLEPFEKSETSIRMGLSRGVQKDLFVNEKQGSDVYYRLTDQAIQSFDYWQRILARFQSRIKLQHKEWDGNWNIVLFNSINLKKSVGDIDQFTEALEQIGYGSLSKGQWVSPYDFSGEVQKLAEKFGLKKEMFLFQGGLQNKKPETIVSEVWPVWKLANRYKEYEQLIHEWAGKLNAESNPGRVLTFLYLLGSELFEIIQDDPQLPVELLPSDWQGPHVARRFWEIREQVLPGVNNYVSTIIEA
ncbi:MAG: hypothetical protein FH756_15770 [Firmicutes bacterium]|nr:hypothetical protein [Bacillota bacterium]